MSIYSDQLFSCILSDVGDYRSDPLVDWDTNKVAARKLLVANVLGKFQDTINTETTEGTALLDFHRFNRRCKVFELPVHLQSWESQCIDTARDILRQFYFAPKVNSPESILLDSHLTIAHHGSLGPGANLGTRFTDFYGKLFSSELTMTSDSLYYMYRDYVRHLPVWDSADKARSSEYGERVVQGSKLSFVPKNVRTARTIATEPTLNMFFQLGIGNLIRDRLRTFFSIDLSTAPDINRRLARIGSLDGSHATIDLSSASDSIAFKLCESLLPPTFLSWLKLCRSPSTSIRGESCALEHISTMGNGFTFPLQTLMFSSLVVACLKTLNMPSRYGVDWCVFGDDIIVPTRAFEFVNHILWLCGFVPNATKSFVIGPFRESCGHDYYNGHNVRSVYIKTLKTHEARYVAYNRLLEWSEVQGIPLRESLGFIRSSVPTRWIPKWEMPDGGLHTEQPQGLVRRGKNGTFLYKVRVVKPRFVSFASAVSRVSYGHTSYCYNADGLMVSLLRGDIRDGKVTPRQAEPTYFTKTKRTPNWEYGPSKFWVPSEWCSPVY